MRGKSTDLLWVNSQLSASFFKNKYCMSVEGSMAEGRWPVKAGRISFFRSCLLIFSKKILYFYHVRILVLISTKCLSWLRIILRIMTVSPEPVCCTSLQPCLVEEPEVRVTVSGLKGSTEATGSDLLTETLPLREEWNEGECSRFLRVNTGIRVKLRFSNS